jgi:hypothetical protein
MAVKKARKECLVQRKRPYSRICPPGHISRRPRLNSQKLPERIIFWAS